MTNLRLVLLATALFGSAFAGVSFFSKGTPMVTARAPVAQPAPPDSIAAPDTAPDTKAAPPNAVETALQPERPPQDNSAAAKSGILNRDQIRITAIQAATAYALAPCDIVNKAAFVVAASTYMRAASEGNNALAPTPMDVRVHQAMQAALKTGGLAVQDFPDGAAPWDAATLQSRRDSSPCTSARRAQRTAR